MATQSILLLVPHDNCMMLAVQHAVEHFSSTRSLSASPALSTSPLIPSNLLNLPGVTQVSALLILIDVNSFKSALVLIRLAKKLSLFFLLALFLYIHLKHSVKCFLIICENWQFKVDAAAKR